MTRSAFSHVPDHADSRGAVYGLPHPCRQQIALNLWVGSPSLCIIERMQLAINVDDRAGLRYNVFPRLIVRHHYVRAI
jgi:hypothetical protein